MQPIESYKDTFPYYRSPERAGWYASLYARADLLEFEKIFLDRNLKTGPQRLLVLGAGTGRETGGLSATEGPVICVEQSWEMIRRRREPDSMAGRLGWTAADALELPFQNGVFDGVLAFNVLHTLVQGRDARNPHEGFLAECRRVLKPDGALLLWVRLSPSPILQTLASLWGLPGRLSAALADPSDVPRWKTEAFYPDPFLNEDWISARTPLKIIGRECRMAARHLLRSFRHGKASMGRVLRRRAGLETGLHPRDACLNGQWGHFFERAALERRLTEARFRVRSFQDERELVAGRPPRWGGRCSYFACVRAEPL